MTWGRLTFRPPMTSSFDPLSGVPAALRPGLHCALGILLEAFNSAEVSERASWEFAVEIASLHAAGVTNAVLRLLFSNGLIQHAVEQTKSRNATRRFAEFGRLRFCDRSCFILTDAGVRAARILRAEPALPTAERPYWDDANHTLFWRRRALKHFRSEAPYQEAVLRAFQAQEWPHCVTVTFPREPGVSSKERLHDTVKNLNRNVRPYLRFRQEGSGSRVSWESAD